MKVYVITWWSTESLEVCGVYDSMEKARKAFFDIIDEELDGVENGFLADSGEILYFCDNEEDCFAEQKLEVVVKEVE